MKKWIVAFLLCATLVPVLAQGGKRKPENLTMTLAQVVDAGEPRQYVFVIKGVLAFKTLDGLQKYLKELPQGSSLTWAPGCCRIGGEPLLSSPEEMRKFKEFCESIGLKFTLVPSG